MKNKYKQRQTQEKIQVGCTGGVQHHHMQQFGNLSCIHVHQTQDQEKNGRINIKALRARYHKQAMQDMYINEARKTLDRAIKFEVFNSKFQNSVNILDSYGYMFNVKRLQYKIATDIMHAKLNSIHGNYYCQLFGNK